MCPEARVCRAHVEASGRVMRGAHDSTVADEPRSVLSVLQGSLPGALAEAETGWRRSRYSGDTLPVRSCVILREQQQLRRQRSRE